MRTTPGNHEALQNSDAGRAAAGGHCLRNLRAELHAAAGPDGIAAHRTADTLATLRERADWFRVALELYAGTGLGYWYAELATRHDQLADEIAASAEQQGIFGGAA